MNARREISIIGAGLAGGLLATLLAQRGWSVDVFERRPDPRRRGYEGGRSINLALAERGLHALRVAGLTDQVMAQAVMMRGRMVHPFGAEPQLQRYGRDDSEVIWSIHRGRLNLTLLDAAERAGARLHFEQGLGDVDWARRELVLGTPEQGLQRRPFAAVVGADGAGSALRQALAKKLDLGERFEPLGHGYKELEIPPADHGDFRIEPNALHIWPRGGYMCIALPNSERTFTVTLFLPLEGPHPSFATVRDGDSAEAFFREQFADTLPLIPGLRHDFDHHPLGQLGTLRLSRWHDGEHAVLLGDAAHAMVPFHGQGMNCAFEDCLDLAERLTAESIDIPAAFAAFERERMPNAAAIQAMALENYIEMRDRVDDADFLLQRQLERLLAERHPGRFVPRYALVSFQRVPYATAFERGRIQREILIEATRGCERIEQVDLVRVDALVRERIAPL